MMGAMEGTPLETDKSSFLVLPIYQALFWDRHMYSHVILTVTGTRINIFFFFCRKKADS